MQIAYYVEKIQNINIISFVDLSAPFNIDDNDFIFSTSKPDDTQAGGVGDRKKSKNAANILSFTPFVLLTSLLVLLLRV